MTDFRRFPDGSSRQLISFNRFMELTGEKVFLCLDKGVLEIAKYLLNTRGSWRTTYVKEYVGTIGYNMPTELEFEEVTKAIAEGNIDMASCNDIVEAINGVKDAISSTQQSGGCGCVMGGDTDLQDTIDTEPQEEPSREGSPPTGNATWEEYDGHKCDWITKILADYIGTLRNYGGLFGILGGLTVAVIVGLTLLTVPPVGFALLMAALGTLLLIDIGSFAYFTALADELESDENLLCDLYNSTSTDEMKGVMFGRLTDIIPTLPGITGAIEASLLDAANSLLSNALFDQAVNNGGVSPDGYTGSTCDCGGSGLVAIQSDSCDPEHLAGEIIDGDLENGTVRLLSNNIPWPNCAAGDTVAWAGIGRVNPADTLSFTWTKHEPSANVTILYLDEEGEQVITDTNTASQPIVGWSILFQSIGTNHPEDYIDITINYEVV